MQRLVTPENKKWWTLGAVAFGLFMIMLDNTIVNVALPTMQRSLHLKISELEWVVTGYALTFGAFMLTGGKLADLFGRRFIFVVGLVVFTASSLACGLAGSATVLIAARVVQGLGAALMNPSTLSIITVTFPPRQRGTAIGIWAGVSALALAIGPLVGGIIAERINWNWIFFINVPIGVIAIASAFLLIDESRDTSHEQRPDIPGLLTSALGLFALSYALIEANNYGWTSTRILLAFAVAVVALAAFVLLERHQRLPMLELSLFRNKTFAGANSVMLLVGLAMFGVFFYISLYVQQVLGYSAIQAGASFLPWTLLIIVLAPQAGRLSDRIGSRALVAGGMVVLTGSLVLFARMGTHESFWGLLPAMLLGGVGMSSAMAPTTAAAMAAVQRDKAGVGSAVLNSMRQVGGSLGIAIMGAIVAAGIKSSAHAGHPRPVAFVNGLHHGLDTAAAIALAGALIAALTLQGSGHAGQPEHRSAVAEAA
ncbi:MAG: MFS transporter [Actinobacteria bacterium]|nr:MFS transporter [Actinomycetota bacterium]MBV8395197.1 MFS transporter [Actinomycetota bacterium]MBV8599846.1 MFS transporter [Actinomycetota bacterium]